jgi:hypothetical protein
MNHSSIMKGAAAVATVFGLALLLAPNALVALYKAPAMNEPGVYNSMLYGALLLGFAVMNWNASQATALQARPVILGSFVSYALALAVALIRQLTAPAPAAAWLNVAIFLVFTALYGYLTFAHQPAAAPAAGATA